MINNLKNIKDKKDKYFIYFIYFYIFVTPLHFSKSQTAFLSAILLIWGIIKYKKEILNKLKEKAFFLPILLFISFISYTYISLLWSDNISVALRHVNNFNKYYFLFVPALLISLNKETAKTSIKIITISFGVYAIYSILIYLGFFNSSEYGFSSNNPTGHLRYLTVSQYMSIGFFSSLFFIYYSNIKEEKVLFFSVSLLTFFALFINNSRTAQLSFLLVSIIFMMIFIKKYIFNLKYLIVISLTILIGLFTLFENDKLSRFETAYKEFNNVVQNNDYKGSFGVRLYFNKVGIEILGSNLFFGTGPVDNRHLLREKQKTDPYYVGDDGKGRIINHFHSEHMDKLTAYGIIGYSFLLLAIIYLIYSLRNEKLYYYISLSVFLTLFFNSFANKTLSVKPLNYIYIIFFILLAIIAYNEKNIEKKIKN